MNASEFFNLDAVNDDYLFVITRTELLLRNWLQNFADSSEFFSQMQEVFGEVNVTGLQQKWSIGEVEFPEVKVVSSEEIKGANGAYSAALNTIYFSDLFLQDNAENLDKIVSVFLEEYAHHLDAQLNVVDTMGDEGEKFSAVVRGVEISAVELERIDRENDKDIVTLEGQIVEIEKNTDDKALSFDGADDYVSIPHDESLSLTTFTVEAWVNPSQIKNSWQLLVNKQNNYSLWIEPNGLRVLPEFVDANNATYKSFYSQKPLTLHQWNHIAITYDGSKFSLYMNGELDNSLSVVAIPYQNTEPVKIGIHPKWQPFNGELDEVRIWNIARTAEEIQNDYAQELTGTETGLVGYWQFNEGTGTTVTDLSSNNNNGNILGDATFASGVFSPGTFVFSKPNFTVTETGHPLTEVTINRIDGLGGDASVTVNLSDGSATSPDDYNNTPIVVDFLNGETSKTVTIPIINDDIADSSETINLSLINATNGATIGEQDTASLMIFEDTALSFDGVDDYVEIPHDESLSLTTFTVEAWVHPIQIKGDWQPLITKENSSGGARNYGLFIEPNSMRVLFSFLQDNGSTWRYEYSQSALILNQWNHITMTYDESSFKFYLNGVLDNSLNIAVTPIQNNEPVKIGKEISAYTPFSGEIDEVRIWNIARTGEEIKANYAQELTGNETGLVGYWQFKEGTGDTTVDLSENSNDGTIIGASWSEGFFGNSVLAFSQPEFTVREDGTSSVAVTVVRTVGFNETVTATVNLTDVTTTSDDYSESSVEVTLEPGEESKTVIIPLVDDFLIEGNETVNLTLTNPTENATIGEQNTAILTITDNDFDWYDADYWTVPTSGSNVTLNYPGEQVKVTFSNGNPSLNSFSLLTSDQGVLHLDGLTGYATYYNSTLEASGAESILALPSLTTMSGATYIRSDWRGQHADYNGVRLNALEGGLVDLS
ncbi:MAG: LamG-like jellyroll fold domain-containing protein, partial [Crocosphaera sp.]